MPGFMYVPSPIFSPTRCCACQATKCDGGFIDLLVDSEAVKGYSTDGAPVVADDGGPTFGHLYLCADCVVAACQPLGYVSPQARNELLELIGSQESTIETLRAELEHERSPEAKVVSVAELGRFLGTPAS